MHGFPEKMIWQLPGMVACLLLLLPALYIISPPVVAATLEQQRQQYLDAKKLLSMGKIKDFNTLTEELSDYPLYPYLRYQYLHKRLHKVDQEESKLFIRLYPDFIFTERLKASWLKQLARQKKWQVFLDNYTPQKELKLRCQQLQARIKTNNHIYLLEDTRTLWLAGESLPSQCDQAFKLLYASPLMTDELVWQRIRLAIDSENIGLANYLGRYLSKAEKIWLQRWLAMHRAPLTQIRKMAYTDTALAREILLYGIKRLTKQDVNQVLRHWPKLQDIYSFIPAERDKMDVLIALRAAKTKHKNALILLDNLNASMGNEDVFHWRIKTALKTGNWQKLYQWTKNPPPDIESIKYRWIYWRARAIEKIADLERARLSYALIAKERDYYGFLAADRIGVAYKMNNYPLQEDIEGITRVANRPGIRRARELFILYGNGYKARREWQHVLKSMTNYQKQLAAHLAAEWGWHDRAIFTVASAKAFDDLKLRFPLLYRNEIEKYAAKRELDASWIFALMRAESAFMEKVKSPAGALGLMQVMPATGRLVSKKIGINNFRSADLLIAEKNIQIGSAYMKEMQDKFNGNYVLATAAYNAGPGRVVRWSPKKPCQEADIWVELIPFNETRKYVKRVMFYSNIYDGQLGNQSVSQQRMMTHVHPYHVYRSLQDPNTAVKNIACAGS